MSLLAKSERLVQQASEHRSLSTQAHAVNVPKARAAKLKNLSEGLKQAITQRDVMSAIPIPPEIQLDWVRLVSAAIKRANLEIAEKGDSAFSDSRSEAFKNLEDHGNPLLEHVRSANRKAWERFVDEQLNQFGLSSLRAAQPDPGIRELIRQAQDLADRAGKTKNKVPTSSYDVQIVETLVEQIRDKIEKLNQSAYPPEVSDFMLKVQYSTATVDDLTEEVLRFLKERGSSKELRIRR